MQQISESTARARRPLAHALGGVAWRLLALLLCLEVSGLAHALIDASELLMGATHHQQDADDCDDAAGHECPPGCPNCHGAHAAIALRAPCVQPRPRLLASVRVAARVVTAVALPPKSADLGRLDRPPRAA